MRTRVKICGITRMEDMQAAVAHGCDAIGLVFHAKSPRHVTIEQGALMVANLPPFVSAVGLFVDAPADDVRAVLREVRLDLLQFHGDESPQYCSQFGMPYLKAVRVRPGLNLLQYAADFDRCGWLAAGCLPGRSGWRHRPDFRLEPGSRELDDAGGAGRWPECRQRRRRHSPGQRPYAVDVSGGVEREKGIKDADKIAAFMRGVSDADV